MIPADQTRDIHIWTDASGLFGCGALDPTCHRWIQLAWPPCYSERALNLGAESITFKEVFPIVLACAVWGQELAGSCVVVHVTILARLLWSILGTAEFPRLCTYFGVYSLSEPVIKLTCGQYMCLGWRIHWPMPFHAIIYLSSIRRYRAQWVNNHPFLHPCWYC